MKIDVELVKELRKKTSAGVMDCKKALEEAEGDVEKAIAILRKRGISKAEKKADRETKQGIVASYIHFDGQLGALVEINCETDFVSGNEEFKVFAEELALHIAATQPRFIDKDEVSEDVLDKEREIYRDQFKDSNKPADVIDKIVENKLNKYYEENCLLYQPFVKDDKKTVQDFVKENIVKFGENIKIARFSVFRIGE